MIPILSAARQSRYDRNLQRHVSLLAPLPAAYQAVPVEERRERIRAAIDTLGEDLLLLGHNYQTDDVIEWAHHTGDSYYLSKVAAESPAKHIVFCGVTFMAETADLLTGGKKNVIVPSMEASCPMAGMAEMVQVSKAWAQLGEVLDLTRVVPVTYVNSYADLKAFTAEHGGLCCTSSNSRKAFKWAFERGDKLLFLPDKHLAHNTAKWMGIPDDELVTFNPWEPELGGLTPEALQRAKVILWEGYCQVHHRFGVRHVEEMRRDFPGIKVIVHPECPREVVEAADEAGSTNDIIDYVERQPAGTKLAIGTEIHLVKRLAKQHPDKEIHQLCGPTCLDCNAMRQVDPRYLVWVLEELVKGNVVNRVRIDDADRDWGRIALERMMEL